MFGLQIGVNNIWPMGGLLHGGDLSMGENLHNGECSGQFCLAMSQPENGSRCFAVKNYINLTHLGIK